MIKDFKSDFKKEFKDSYFNYMKYLLALILLVFSCENYTYKLFLPSLFSDGMVLQRNTEIAIWGKSYSNKEVKVYTDWGEKLFLKSDMNGRWASHLKTPEAGGPYLIKVISVNDTVLINNVLIGEVWLASGQSNMEMPLKGWLPNDPILNSDYEVSKANYPNIRMFTVEKIISDIPLDSLKGSWVQASPEFVKNFSATAYFFARELYKNINIPIGIIHSSWGGTPAEAWTSESKLRDLGFFVEDLDNLKKTESQKVVDNWFSQWPRKDLPKGNNSEDMLEDEYRNLQFSDSDLSNVEFDDLSWNKAQLPGRFDNLISDEFDGAVWFRKEVVLDDINSDYKLNIGAIDDMDKTFFNGEYIGGLSGFGFWNIERELLIPKSILKKGKNIIAIRAIDTGGPGTFKGPMTLSNNSGKLISIAGIWRYKPIAEIYLNKFYIYDFKIKLSNRPRLSKLNQNLPNVLFNGMINPIIPYSIKGVIWYQGESNIGRHDQYQYLFPGMIEDWRNRWNKDFPFYYVQIAPFTYVQDPKRHISQKLRDSQRNTLKTPKTGMVVTLDIGDIKNIHPANKQEVGKRLARLALSNDYGFELIPSSPIYRSCEIINNKIKLNFDYAGSGLINKISKKNQFEISGSDKKYYKANIKVNKDHVFVSSDYVREPKYIRYAWSDTPSPTLFNSEGLPASSFLIELE